MSVPVVKIDDVLSVVNSLGTAIQKKMFTPEEFRKVQPAWERLSDTLAQLQRKNIIEKLYPQQPVQQPVQPVPVIHAGSSVSGSSGIINVQNSHVKSVDVSDLPTDYKSVEGCDEDIREIDDKIPNLQL